MQRPLPLQEQRQGGYEHEEHQDDLHLQLQKHVNVTNVSCQVNKLTTVEPAFLCHMYVLHRVPATRSCRFGDCFLASSLGLVGRTTVAMQPRKVVYASSNAQKSNHQTDMNE